MNSPGDSRYTWDTNRGICCTGRLLGTCILPPRCWFVVEIGRDDGNLPTASGRLVCFPPLWRRSKRDWEPTSAISGTGSRDNTCDCDLLRPPSCVSCHLSLPSGRAELRRYPLPWKRPRPGHHRGSLSGVDRWRWCCRSWRLLVQRRRGCSGSRTDMCKRWAQKGDRPWERVRTCVSLARTFGRT